MDEELRGLASGEEPDGPGLAALDLLYRFVAAVELTPNVAVYSCDRSGIVRYWNKTCAHLFGVAMRDAIGKPLTSLITHPGQEHEFADLIASIWRTGNVPAPRDWLILRPDGVERWVHSSQFAVQQDGLILHVLSMEVDVTGRKVEEQSLLAAGANFRTLFERSTDAIVLVRGREIADANPAAVRLFHYAGKHELVGRSLLDFSPDEQPCGESSLRRDAELAAQAFDDGNQRYEWMFQTRGGEPFWAEVLRTSVAINHEHLSYAVIRDISLRKSTERTLTMAAQVFENCRDAILIIDSHYRVVAANQAFGKITGFAPLDVIGREVPSLRSGLHEPAFYRQIWDFVDIHDHWEGELIFVRSSAEVYPVWVALTAIRDAGNRIRNYMAILSDITDRKQIEQHTRHLAEHDYLTDLPNRVLFLDRLHQALANARRQQTKVAVMFLDLDRFKAINDTLGHLAGDAVLKEVAVRLVRCVRGVDTVSRLGGDEFVVILADIGGADQAAHVAGSVMSAVSQPMWIGDHEHSVSVSIGISIFPCDGEDVDTLLRHADIAMYHAKRDGRNGYQFFSPEMNANVVERVEMENRLRLALANREFVLEYQPEIDIASGRTVGVEALIRWRHPERGLLGPAHFIPIAESSGLIVPIGQWVLNEACAKARAWRDQGYQVVVAVNLSAVQFVHEQLLQHVDDALAAAGLEPQMLDLEITEAMIMSGDERSIATANALRRRGVKLTVDNFGTGCSSLATLRRYALSKLKIDRSFVEDISRNPDDAAIIPAIIAVARSLRLRVIAEGVETDEQLRFLRQHGCDEYQGFYSGPAPGGCAPFAAPLADFIRRNP